MPEPSSGPGGDSARVRPRGALDARLRVPGSRSQTNRALACAALAGGTSRLPGATASDDTEAMASCLEALGARVERAPEAWTVTGVGGRLRAPKGPLDVRASGTTARFLTALATLADGPVEIDGAPRMRERPIDELASALGALGAPVEVLGRGGCPPVRVAGGGLPGGAARVDARRSSQFVSGILLAAPYAGRDVALRFVEDVLVSRAFVELTVDVMRAFDAELELGTTGARVTAGRLYRACEHPIEPDAQSAVYGFAAAAIAGGRVLVEGLPPASRQTDLRVLDVFEQMGCRVERLPEGIAVTGPPGGLRSVEVDMNAIPDAVLALAVVALFARGPTTIRGIGHLPIKESDRLAALQAELARLGARAEAGADWLRVEPGPLRGARIRTYDDHRMAMSFALAGLRVPGVVIEDPDCVAKTWPGFFSALDRL